MIERNEVFKIAKNLNLRPDTVEKDYVLGWMLYGISEHPVAKTWAFKGGTSLKKCFFETFRFSEDLDFTIKENTHLDADFLLDTFYSIAESLSETVGIEFFPDRFTFKIIDKGDGKFSAQGKIHYNGPLRRKQGAATIKLDLTTDEIIVLNTVRRKVEHTYPDEPARGIHANCYAFEEVVAEKIRALAQRIRPRDLYDLVLPRKTGELIPGQELPLSGIEVKSENGVAIVNLQVVIGMDFNTGSWKKFYRSITKTGYEKLFYNDVDISK